MFAANTIDLSAIHAIGGHHVGDIDTTGFAPIQRRGRVRTEGQQQRMDRRKADRTRNAGRKQGRAVKRSQAFA
ncbi:hypothetical protein [Stenotrophomonas phage BUCT603B1]|nr:hypothetical protein [Stenotrophomonas phage BUCT603B1]HDS1003808.1 hypothetical protein [Stenotrophomonas maltophilia]